MWPERLPLHIADDCRILLPATYAFFHCHIASSPSAILHHPNILLTARTSTTIDPVQITLTYRLAYPEFREATKAVEFEKRRLRWRQVRWPRVMLFSAVFFILAVALVSMVVISLDKYDWIPNSWRNIPEIPDSASFIAAALTWIAVIYAARTRPRRLWKAAPHLSLPHTLTVTDAHLTESSQSTTRQVPWQDTTSWLETENTLIILLKAGHIIIPKHPPLQSNPEKIEPFKSLLILETKTLNPTTAFPIQPDESR